MPSTAPYTIIKAVLTPEECSLISDYIRFRAQLKPNVRKEGILSGVHRQYADPLMESLLVRFQPLIEQTVSKTLFPTLSFCYEYQKGHSLPPHKDRSSCEIVAGLCINADPHFKKADGKWPLWFKSGDESFAAHLDYGDLVIFHGHSTEHWRDPLTGDWFISAILAYVDTEGPYSFQKYDQRKALGRPHVGMFFWLWGYIRGYLLKRFSRFKRKPRFKLL